MTKDPINLRDMHYKSWRKIILFCFSIGLSLQVSAQFKAKDNYNYLDFQKKNYYFGISLGIHNSGYQVYRSQNFVSNDSINIVDGVFKPGFNLNIITNLKIGNHFDLRFLPGFAFTERQLSYTSRIANSQSSTTQLVKSINSVFLEVPFLLRFKSEPYKDKRLFLVSGVKYSYDVVSNSNSVAEKSQFLVQVSPHDFQLEVGFGMQFFFPFFIFSPEFKFSQGVGNVHIYKDDLIESRILENIQSRSFSISFNFEG